MYYSLYSAIFRDRIERSNLEGVYREVIVDSVVHPFSITVFQHHIYWTDWQLGKPLLVTLDCFGAECLKPTSHSLICLPDR